MRWKQQHIIEVMKKLCEAATARSKAVLFVTYEIVGFKIGNQLLPDDSLVYLDDV